MQNLQERQRRILAIDDDPVTLAQFREVLGERYKVFFALDGEQAIEMLDDTQPDLIIIDVRLPGADGPQIVRKLRRYTSVPVMMVSSYPQDVTEDELVRLHIHSALIKPVDPEVLEIEVDSLLDLHSLRTNEAL